MFKLSEREDRTVTKNAGRPESGSKVEKKIQKTLKKLEKNA